MRNLHILLYLAQRHDVTLLTFTPEGGVIDRSRLEPLCRRIEILPAPVRSTSNRIPTLLTSSLPDMAWRLYSASMQERIDALLHQDFDAIHVEGIEMAPYALNA